jgi:nitrile hydratase subunit alpha
LTRADGPRRDQPSPGGPPDPVELRTKALEALLVEKGLLSHDAVERVVVAYEHDIGPMLGARAVARAWVDADFKQRLLQDTGAACRELGIATGMEGGHMQVLENTAEVHNVVVCTLCSCYPWPVLGLPPSWYKSAAYRATMVRAPRRTLAESFGMVVPDDVEIRVWDSSSETRYWVLPERPAGTADWTEEALVPLVSRDAMIGVARAAGT